MKLDLIFSFDVESIGLHGEGFFVGGGVYKIKDSLPVWEFVFACPPIFADGLRADRVWVGENVPKIIYNASNPKQVRQKFWEKWLEAKSQQAAMVVDCGWPVESRFMIQCVQDDTSRTWEGPYPCLDVATMLIAAGRDPLEQFPRNADELPKHHPLKDARQSARIFCEAYRSLNEF